MEVKEKPRVRPEQRKAVLTAFILLFPSLLIGLLTMTNATTAKSVFAVLIFFYQAVIIKNFIDDQVGVYDEEDWIDDKVNIYN